MSRRLLALMMGMTMIMGALTGCGSAETSEGGQASETVASETASGEGAAAESSSSETGDGSLQKVKDAGVLKVGCKVDVPCFGLQNTATGAYEGLEVDLAYEIAGDIFGVTAEEAKAQDLVEFQGVTAKTRGPLLESGEIDMVAATFTITEERKTQYNFSTPYIEDALGLMCLQSSGYTAMTDLDGATIGVAQGSTTKDTISEYIAAQNLGINVTFEEFDGYPALSAALAAGNIDVFSVDRAILAGYNDETTMILPERFGTQEYGIATALENVELAEEVDKVVTDLLASGRLDEMIKAWGIE